MEVYKVDIKDSLEGFVGCGISLRRIAEAAKINKNTISAVYKGDKVNPKTVEKVKGALKDIALELYNIAYADDINDNEEWED